MFGVGSFQKWNRFGQGPYNIWHFKKHVLNGLKSFLLSIDRITHGTACNRLHGFRGTFNSKITCRNSYKVGSEFCNKTHWIKFQPGSQKILRNSIRKKFSIYSVAISPSEVVICTKKTLFVQFLSSNTVSNTILQVHIFPI